MSIAEDLGKLIIMMNPYAGGTMEPHTFLQAPPNSATGATGATPSQAGPTPAAQPSDATCIWMEADRYGVGDWNFKGQPHRVALGLRIAYRWKKVVAGQTVWITDYLLIGYEGSNGGG
jgi:hypothetical protein